MQELIVNILLAAVALLAAVLQLIGQRSSSGMTKNKRSCSGAFWQQRSCCWASSLWGHLSLIRWAVQAVGCGWLSI